MKKLLFGSFLTLLFLVGAVPTQTNAMGTSEQVTFTATLSVGSSGPSVVALQQLLINKGYLKTKATGFYGNKTKAAVSIYQEANGLVPVGFLGPKTRNLMNIEVESGGAVATQTPLVTSTGTSAEAIYTISITAPNIIVNGKNLLSVKLYAVKTGATIGIPIGSATLQSTGTSGDMKGVQTWVYSPKQWDEYAKVYAEGYNEKNQLVGTVTLSIQGVEAIYNAIWAPTTPNTASTQASTTSLVTFNGINGTFLAKSYGLTSVKVYYVPTGTTVTTATLLGSMTLTSTSTSGAQAWSMSAYPHKLDGSLSTDGILATSLYAVGYVGTTQVNQINYPYTGASDIYSHLY